MLALVPVAAVAWEFKPSVVERILEDAVDTAERQCLVATCLEIQVVLEPVIKFTPAPQSGTSLWSANQWREPDVQPIRYSYGIKRNLAGVASITR